MTPIPNRFSGTVFAVAHLHYKAPLIAVLVRVTEKDFYVVNIPCTNYRIRLGDAWKVQNQTAYWTPDNHAHSGSTFDVVGPVVPSLPMHEI